MQYATLRRLHRCSLRVVSGGICIGVPSAGETPLMARHSERHSSMRSVRVVMRRSRMMKYPSLDICFPSDRWGLPLPPPSLLEFLLRIWKAVLKHPSARPYSWMMLGWSRHASNAVSWARSSAPITNFLGWARTAGRRHFKAKTLGFLRLVVDLPKSPLLGGRGSAVDVRIWLMDLRLALLANPSPLDGIRLRSLEQLNARESMLASRFDSPSLPSSVPYVLRVRLDDHPLISPPFRCSGSVHVTSKTSQKFPLPRYSPMIRSDFLTWGTRANFFRSMTDLKTSPCSLFIADWDSEWSASSCSRRSRARLPAYSSMRCCSIMSLSSSASWLERLRLSFLLLLLRREPRFSFPYFFLPSLPLFWGLRGELPGPS
mmetsp:Transcript_28352/g.60048  ORF Transcript_28352/g.60048 Transcript_28352/m.60048 type:complete len:373 (-) Transcript_28352:1429-2547(-)